MKVLVVSLLRLGDLLQMAPILTALKRQMPRYQVDLLTHVHPKLAQSLLPSIEKWWLMDRDELQSGLGEAEIPLLTSFSVLKEQLDQINEQKYDLIINLTQTQFSAWIMAYLQSTDRLGLSFDRRGHAHFHSPWFRYLNDHTSPGEDVFHHTDIFANACSLDLTQDQHFFSETSKGQREWESLKIEKPFVAIQALTSDIKKNWGLEAWQKTIDSVITRMDRDIVLLGAPFERAQLEKLKSNLNLNRVHLGVVSLEGALSVLNHADLLITGDTSITHLASGARCKVLELSLGSSDLHRTGIYRSGNLILQPRLKCAPCPHSGACSQPTHACAQQLDPEIVSEIAQYFLTDAWNEMSTKAQKVSAKTQIFKSRILSTGFWVAEELSQTEPLKIIDSILDRSTLKLAFNNSSEQIVTFGSEGVRLKNEISDIVDPMLFQSAVARLDFLEQDLCTQQGRFEVGLWTLKRERPVVTDQLVDVTQLRQQQRHLKDEARKIEIKIKLVRSLRSQLMENT